MGHVRQDHASGAGVTETGIPVWPLYNGTADMADLPAGTVAFYFQTVNNLKLVGRTHAGDLFSGDVLITS